VHPNDIVSTLNNVASGQKYESDDSEEEEEEKLSDDDKKDEDNQIFRRVNVSIISIDNKIY
jgi:hypothetical protein